MENMIPPMLLAAGTVAVKWTVDLLGEAWPEAPALAKRVAAFVVSLALCAVTRSDVLAALRPGGGELTGGGVVLTAVIVAALAGEVVHPVVGLVRAVRDSLDLI